MLSPQGTCRSFDSEGNGYCRSEAVVVVFLQKEPTANRIYASLVHARSNSDGGKEQGITFPSGEVQKRLLGQVYAEAGINPAHVSYVEAHGTGTKAGDPQELNSMTDVFCTKDRQGPLLIGSTKSNMGHPEPASGTYNNLRCCRYDYLFLLGLAALAKVIIAMEDGAIPANLHFNSPNTDIPGLTDGRLSVVSERTTWDGGYVGVNSFGFGGSNVHAILKSHSAPVVPDHPAADKTRLVTLSGRTEEAVRHSLDKMSANAGNIDLQSLLQMNSDAGHPFRGYKLLNHDSNVEEIQVGWLWKEFVWRIVFMSAESCWGTETGVVCFCRNGDTVVGNGSRFDGNRRLQVFHHALR